MSGAAARLLKEMQAARDGRDPARRATSSDRRSLSAASSSRLTERQKHPAARSASRVNIINAGGSSTQRMRAQLAATKNESSDIEAKLRSITSFQKAQKKRTALQGHHRDWWRARDETQRERAELEGAIVAWVAQAARAAAGPAEGPVADADAEAALGALQAEEAECEVARREWSVEMRAQLLGLRELCAASRAEAGVAHAGMARQLVCEMRQSVDVQGVRLAATAAALEADLRALDTTSALGDADDDDAPAGSSAAGGGAEEDIVALSGAFVAPAELRTEGEARLVAHLEEMLKAERAAQRDELRALQADHPEVLCAPPRLPEKADPGKAALLRAEIYYDAAGGRPPRLSTLGESEYEELTSPGSPTRASTTTHARAAAAKEAMADGAKKIYVQRVVVPPSPRAAADGADDDGDGEADLGGDAIAYARAAAAAAAAGWDARSDERLRQLETQLRDRPHATLLERLAIELPHMGRDACERRLDWLARRRRYVAARRALAAAWAAREGALAIEARAAILGQAEKEARAAEEKGAREARRAKAERLHGEVAGIQVERARRDAEAAAEASERERLEGLVAEAARRRHEAERAHKRALIAQYREERDEEEAREEARRAAGRAEEQRLEAERAAYNLQRVEFRQHQLDVKERVRREEAAAQRILDDLHRAAVERALEAAQPDVPDDPTRALRPTAASAAPAEKEAPLFKTTGYSEATLMKDMRFKLGAALSGAGLGQTAYARQLLSHAAIAPAVRRPDVQTHTKLFIAPG